MKEKVIYSVGVALTLSIRLSNVCLIFVAARIVRIIAWFNCPSCSRFLLFLFDSSVSTSRFESSVTFLNVMSCLTEHIMIDFISNLNWVYELILVITMTALTLKFSGVVYIFWHSPSAGEGRLFRIGSQICCLASPSSPLKSLRYLFILTIRKSRRRSWVSNNLHSWELSLGWLTLFLTDFMGMIFWRGFGPDILFNRLASLPLRFWLCPLFRINLIILCLSSLSFILYVACRLRLIRRIFVFLNISRLLGTVMQTFLHIIKVLV